MATNKVVTVTDPSVVTNDVLSGYNIYSDQDGLLDNATPAEANAGHTVSLSDGVVHQVTAKPVGASNGEFSSVISNQFEVDLSSTSILFEDDFTGATIDTAKWTVTNDTPAVMDISQNNELIFELLNSAAGATLGDDMLIGKTGFAESTAKVYGFDIQVSEQNSSSQWFIGVNNNSSSAILDDRVGFMRTSSTAGDVLAAVYNSGSLSSESVTLDIETSAKTVKIIVNNGSADFYYWNGSGWTKLGATASYTGAGANMYPIVIVRAIAANGTNGDLFKFDNYTVADSDYSTQYPV
jgi:hypothetical protein